MASKRVRAGDGSAFLRRMGIAWVVALCHPAEAACARLVAVAEAVRHQRRVERFEQHQIVLRHPTQCNT